MKKILLKIASVSLAFLVLFSTFSFTVAKHYCGDFLVDVSYVGDADGCGMETNKAVVKKKNCCKDEVYQIAGQDELQKNAVEDFALKQQQFYVINLPNHPKKILAKADKNNAYQDFYPPDIPIDYQVVYQTFLI